MIFDASIDSKEGDEAEILSLLIENYENEHYPIEAPDPIEAIKIRMGGNQYAPERPSWDHWREESSIRKY